MTHANVINEPTVSSVAISSAILLTILYMLFSDRQTTQKSLISVWLAREAWASLAGFSFLAVAFAMSLFAANTSLHLVASIVSVFALFVQARLQPEGASFWHHKRNRFIGVTVLSGLALFLNLILNDTVFIPAIFAILLYQRHIRYFHHRLAANLQDLDAMQRKVLSARAKVNLLTKQNNSKDDKLSQAG